MRYRRCASWFELVVAGMAVTLFVGCDDSSDGGTPTTPPPPVTSWTVTVNSLQPAGPAEVRIGRAVMVRGVYTALEDLNFDQREGLIVGFFDANGGAMQPLGGAVAPVHKGRWGFTLGAFCDIPGEVRILKVAIGRGHPRWGPELEFAETIGVWSFPVEYTCR